MKSETVSDSELDAFVVNRMDDEQFFRPELISRARNIVMDIAMSDAYRDFRYVIWMDMDFKIPPNFDGIVETFESEKQWDAVFAYGIDPSGEYWDWYAFRDYALPIGSELLGNRWWYMPKPFSLDRSSDWHPVYSAFGGCGIYKKSAIEGCRYSAVVTKDLAEVATGIIREGKSTGHPQVSDYLELNGKISSQAAIEKPRSKLTRIREPNVGVILDSGENALVWRMSSFVYQYPSTCEHVPFHACMIRNGHKKLFINPRLVFHYGG